MPELECEDLGKRVSLDKKTKWNIPAKDILTIDGQPYVKIDIRSHTLIALVRAGSKLIPKGCSSMAGNLGIQEIIQKRNDACDAEDLHKRDGCSLFDELSN